MTPYSKGTMTGSWCSGIKNTAGLVFLIQPYANYQQKFKDSGIIHIDNSNLSKNM